MRLLSLALVLSAALLQGQADTPEQPAPQRWYKGNLHTHSLWSDGNDVPEMICDWYAKNGYHFLALTDHNTLHVGERWMDINEIIRRGGRRCIGRYIERFGEDWVELRSTDENKRQVRLKRLEEYRGKFEKPGSFLLIQAEEVSSSFARKPIHINVTNHQKRIGGQKGRSIQEVMRKVLAIAKAQAESSGEPNLVHLNHPNFGYAITAEDLAAVVEERFFEVWNGHPGVRHRGDHHHPSTERLWDIANTLRIAEFEAAPLFGMGTDDSHNYYNLDVRKSITGRGWVMVRARQLSPRALLEAMDRGDFYASSGVTLKDMQLSEKAIHLEIEARPGETYVTQFIGTRKGFDRKAEPRLDKEGKPIHSSKRYSAQIGAVLATVRGPKASYRLAGDELYVRAVVTSSATVARPIGGWPEQKQQAWLQPVGWRARVR